MSIIIWAAIALLYTLFGALLIVPFAMSNKAVTSIVTTATAGNVYSNSSSWLGAVSKADTGTFVDGALMLVFGGIAWQVYFQRVLSAPTVRRAQLLSFFAGIGCFAMAVPAALIGAVGFSTGKCDHHCAVFGVYTLFVKSIG